MFANNKRQAAASKAEIGDGYHHYVLSTEVPTLDQSLSPGTQVPLTLSLEDEYGQSLGTVEVGDFTFATATPSYSHAAPALAGAMRKRKQSVEPSEVFRSPPKRTASQQQIERVNRPSSSYPTGHTQMSPYLRAASTGPYGLAQAPQQQQMYSPQVGQEHQQYQYPLLSYGQQEMPSPAMSTVYAPVASRGSSASTSVSRPPHTLPIGFPTATTSTANPTLVRTSGVRASSSGSSIPAASQQAFNPFSLYPTSKAVLKLEGNLDGMVDNWTDDEMAAKRRLVEFQRSQTGGTVTASFKPVTPEQRAPNSICISCILWEDKEECYVTSVDTIYLLESLVAVRFTVEEKNRIRRNLEGFRPLTVSKMRADSKDFFDLIMKFPNPKPRNIEKDVKVFPWKILSHALKKIVGKYVSDDFYPPTGPPTHALTVNQTASYSSTAGALLPTRGPELYEHRPSVCSRARAFATENYCVALY